MGSGVSHFNVSLIVMGKVATQCPQTTASEERGEPKRNRTQILLLTRLTARPNRISPYNYKPYRLVDVFINFACF